MPTQISESDWRQFKKVHKESLDCFCKQIVDDLDAITHSTEGTAYDRYHRAYGLLMDRDKAMARAFDDFRRSRAIMQLAIMREMGLLTDEQLSCFSERTQQMIRGLDSLCDNGSGSPPSD